MKLAWHIAVKDLRRMRLPLLLWAVMLVAKHEIGVNLLRGDAANLPHFDLMRTAAVVLTGFEIFANLILVALLVQEDTVTGTRAFWMTRPVGGARLLAAKLLGATVMFGALPILLSLRLWLVAGFGPADMGRAALLVLDTQVLVVALGFAIASLTEAIGRFLLGLFLAVAGLYFWLHAALQVFGLQLDSGRMSLALLGVVGVAGTVTLLVVRFRRAPRWHALATMGAGLAAASAVVACGPWDWSPAGPAHVPGADRITATVTRADVEHDDPPVRLSYVVANLPDDYGARGRAENTWQLSPRPVITREQLEPIWPEWANWQALGMPPEKFHGPKHRAALITFRHEPSHGRDGGGTATTNAMTFINDAELERLRAEPAPFTAQIRLTLFHPELLLEVTPETGAEAHGHGWRMRVASTTVNNDMVVGRFVESRLLWRGRGARFGLSSFFRGPILAEDEVDYFKVDRARGRIQHLGHGRDGFEMVVGGIAIRWQTMALDAPEQMHGVTLAVLRDEDDGTVEREVRLPQLIPENLKP